MSFRFTPEMFEQVIEYRTHDVADCAQAHLDEYVKTLPEVFSIRDPEEIRGGIDHGWSDTKCNDSVSSARLWGVEEIKPKCEHTHIDMDLPVLTTKYVRRTDIQIKCSQCGKRLVSTWTECEEG